MTAYDLARVVVGIVLGLGLASLPFLHYAARTHHHAPQAPHPAAAHPHRQ